MDNKWGYPYDETETPIAGQSIATEARSAAPSRSPQSAGGAGGSARRTGSGGTKSTEEGRINGVSTSLSFSLLTFLIVFDHFLDLFFDAFKDN